MCKRLRASLPNARIIVGRWGLKDDLVQHQELLRETGADQVETTLLETRTHLQEWLPMLDHGVTKTTTGRDEAKSASA